MHPAADDPVFLFLSQAESGAEDHQDNRNNEQNEEAENDRNNTFSVSEDERRVHRSLPNVRAQTRAGERAAGRLKNG